MELVCKGAVSKLSELLASVTIRLQGQDEDADVPGTDVLHAAQSLEVTDTKDGLSAVCSPTYYVLFKIFRKLSTTSTTSSPSRAWCPDPSQLRARRL